MNRSFETMSMAEILNYVKNTEYNLQSLQQNLDGVRQQIDTLWNQIQDLKNDKKKYILEKSNDADLKNLNLYSGTSELSKEYLGYVSLLRNHLTGKGYDLYDKSDNKCARLVFQGDYFINQVFVSYGISKTNVISKSSINLYEEGKPHQAKEALQTDEFKKYSNSISALVKKLDIPQDVINEINSEQWKYENGKISPELSEMAQKFFYDVISQLDIYKNSLKFHFGREFDKNNQLEVKDNERINLKNEVGKIEDQIRLETDPDNKNSARNKLKFNFVEFLKRDDCIKCVLDYANNAMSDGCSCIDCVLGYADHTMSDENKSALEVLCSFKYWHPDRKKPNYYKSLLIWYTCYSAFFRSLSNGDKEKVLGTLCSFWDGFLKEQDKDVKNNKQLNGAKLNPDESKNKINNYENDKNKTEPKKDVVHNNREQLQNIKLNPNKNGDMNNNEDKFDNKAKGEKKEENQDKNDKHDKNNQEIKIIKLTGNHNLTNNNSKSPLPKISKTKYVLVKWRDNFLRWLQNLWYWITGQNKMWVYAQRDGETENLKLSLLEDKNSIVSLLNECQNKSKKNAVGVNGNENNIKTKTK